MPQFELDSVGPQKINSIVRARSAKEAILRALELSDNSEVEVSEEQDVQGWRDVFVNGKACCRVRLHQRMKFRRD